MRRDWRAALNRNPGLYSQVLSSPAPRRPQHLKQLKNPSHSPTKQPTSALDLRRANRFLIRYFMRHMIPHRHSRVHAVQQAICQPERLPLRRVCASAVCERREAGYLSLSQGFRFAGLPTCLLEKPICHAVSSRALEDETSILI